MDTITDYSVCILDIAVALAEHKAGLTAAQFEQVELIYRRTEDFLYEYMQKSNVTVQELRRYLNHDALSALTVLVASTELMLMNAMGPLEGVYREAVEQLRDYSYALTDEIRNRHDEVWTFMQAVGLEK